MAALVTASASATSLDFFLTRSRTSDDDCQTRRSGGVLGARRLRSHRCGIGRAARTLAEVARRRVTTWTSCACSLETAPRRTARRDARTLRKSFGWRARAARARSARSGHRWSRQRAAAHSHDSTRPGQARARQDRGGRIPIGVKGVRLPAAGGRLRLRSDAGVVALDLWAGDPDGLSPAEMRTLSIAASVLALELSHRHAA